MWANTSQIWQIQRYEHHLVGSWQYSLVKAKPMRLWEMVCAQSLVIKSNIVVVWFSFWNFYHQPCYISFLLSSFYWLFFHMLHFLHLYLFLVSSVFLLFPTFTCTPIYPSTCFHFSFHVLWLCSRPFLSYYDTLYFLWLTFIMLPTYPNAVYKLMYLLSSSSVCKLTLIHLLSYLLSKSPLSSQISLFSLIALLVLW